MSDTPAPAPPPTPPKPDVEKRLEVAATTLEVVAAQLQKLVKRVEHALDVSRGKAVAAAEREFDHE